MKQHFGVWNNPALEEVLVVIAILRCMWVWNIGWIIIAGKAELLGENSVSMSLSSHNSHMDWDGNEPGLPLIASCLLTAWFMAQSLNLHVHLNDIQKLSFQLKTSLLLGNIKTNLLILVTEREPSPCFRPYLCFWMKVGVNKKGVNQMWYSHNKKF